MWNNINYLQDTPNTHYYSFRNCPICNTPRSKNFLTIENFQFFCDDTVSKKFSLHEVQCENCGATLENFNYETNIKIEVISLDNFIKTDIEGSELKALLGAKEILKNQKPKLAICVYHLSNDLWEIPLLIKNIKPSYKLYMGHHSQNLFDTVIYAI